MSIFLPIQRARLRRRVSHPLMLQFLTQPTPSRRTHWQHVSWLAVDLETTGLNSNTCEIASIGWVPIDAGNIDLQSAQHYFVNTKRSVGQSAIYHHIRDEQLTCACPIEQAMDALLECAQGRVLVFHHAQLDMAFLNTVSRQLYDAPILAPIVDTLELEKRKLLQHQHVLPKDSLRLHSCRRRYGLPDYPGHDALTDALAAAELLLAWIAHYDRRERVLLTDCLS